MAFDDDFWDLGTPKAKIYEKPSFSEERLSVTEIADEDAASGKPAEGRETIPPRPAGEEAGKPYVTTSYRRHAVRTAAPLRAVKQPATLLSSYEPEGLLIRRVDVRTWESDAEFYGRFASDALISHRSAPSVPYDRPMEAVPCYSYVPQYAHMSHAQTEYYRWIRENIRHGRYPACDLPYIQLYIFELINLANEVGPDPCLDAITAAWLGYRRTYPRLDGFLSEWVADFCLIHALPLPKEIVPILSEIVPKTQFKEFYLNTPLSGDTLGRIMMETTSDYDCRTSRYYRDNSEAYDRHIPAAVSAALDAACREKRGMFALDRLYRITRDSFCGAVVASGVKRRLDIEFTSFTRRAGARAEMTALVKYAENKLRVVLGIKAKIGVNGLSPEDAASVDAYFAPLIPEKYRRPADERYMPEGSLEAYEAEKTGFDLTAAAGIEAASWTNTARLTGDEFVLPEEPDGNEMLTEEPEGAVTAPAETAGTTEITEPGEPSAGDGQLTGAAAAALDGTFAGFARANGLFEGELAERVNSFFLDLIGDVILEDGGAGFELIEDYREDVEAWLLQNR